VLSKNKTAGETLDAVIIGAGPIGLACAISMKKRGLSHVVIEKGTLVNSLYHYPLNMTFFSTSDKLEIGEVPFISHQPKPTRDEALEYYRRVALHWAIDVRLYEHVLEVTPFEREKWEVGGERVFTINTSRGQYHARNIVVCTGFYDIPNLMDIPGEDMPKVHHYFKEAHPYFKQKIVVVGAANSAVDVALECYRKGAEVTMVVREPSIGDNVKYWVKPDIENRIREGSISAYFNAVLTEIREREVDVQFAVQRSQEVGKVTLENDFVLAMTGYKPDFTFLQRLGLELDPADGLFIPWHAPATMETNIPGIYLAGVICGGMQTNKWFIENSRVHADIVADSIASGRQNSAMGAVVPS
jgi:thioredoxin reductase (NADPH)